MTLLAYKEEVLNQIIGYLATKPYAEVQQHINALQTQVKVVNIPDPAAPPVPAALTQAPTTPPGADAPALETAPEAAKTPTLVPAPKADKKSAKATAPTKEA